MSDNGQEWVWCIALVDGYGHVCFQELSEPPTPTQKAVRRITTIVPKETGPGKVDFSFEPHLFHAYGLYPDIVMLSIDSIVSISHAPAKVCAVLDETWEPTVIVSATPAQASQLGDKA